MATSTNPILNGLISGSLAKLGKIVFDNTKACWLIEFKSGAVGVYVHQNGGPKTYNQYQMVNGMVQMSPISSNGKFLVAGINSFFDGVLDANHAIANMTSDKLKAATAVDPNFIINVYWYNPKAAVPLEIVDPSHYVIGTDKTKKYNTAQAYLTTVGNREVVNAAKKVAVKALAALINATIARQQRAKTNKWTVGGLLILSMSALLDANPTLKQQLSDVVTLATSKNYSPPLTLNGLITEAVTTLSSWVLGYTVDLSVNPFIYLRSKSSRTPSALPAVPPSNPAVAQA